MQYEKSIIKKGGYFVQKNYEHKTANSIRKRGLLTSIQYSSLLLLQHIQPYTGFFSFVFFIFFYYIFFRTSCGRNIDDID